MAGAPTTAAIAAPTGASAFERHRTAFIIAGAVVALVLVGGGAFALGRSDQPDAAAGTAGSQGSTDGTGFDSGTSDPETAPETDSFADDVEEPAVLVDCWDGTQVESGTPCPRFRGLAALRTAFPSMDQVFDRCTRNPPAEGKVQAWSCPVTLSSGTTISVVYSEWQDFATGDVHYHAKFDNPPQVRESMNFWDVDRRPMSYQASAMYAARYPFSFSVIGQTESEAIEGVDYVEWADASELPRR